MKAVLLAGGMGSRMSEETDLKPKPMAEIGGRPMLWHIMKIYSAYGINEFVICCGYKGHIIKEYFANYFLHQSDLTIDLADNRVEIHQSNSEAWKISLVDTGLSTMTGGRIKRVASYLGNEPFLLTYGDGVADIDIARLLEFHKTGGKLATVTVVRPLGRFGALHLGGEGQVLSFQEKVEGNSSWINGGFFVLEPQVLDYLSGDETVWEREPLERLADEGQLSAFKHEGFWQPMDTLREKRLLEELWQSGKAPWKVW